jgi:hypothetical protein
MRNRILATLLLFFVGLGVYATAPTAERVNASFYLGRGTVGRDRKLLDFDEASTTTDNAQYEELIELAASTSTTVDLSTKLDSCRYFAVQDVSSAASGFLWGPNTTNANKFTVTTNGCAIVNNGAATPPTLYFTNPSGSATIQIKVVAIGSRS